MPAMRLVVAAAVLVLQVGAFAVGQPSALPEQRTATRIAEISKRFATERRQLFSADDWEKEQLNATTGIREEAIRFIVEWLNPLENHDIIQARLRVALRAYLRENTDPSVAHVANLRFGRSLVLLHAVPRPPHFASSRVFGFREDLGRYRLTATTGEDFEDHSMVTRVLESPSPGEFWLLVGGRAMTFNGSKFRFRVYSFDGDAFVTRWNPEDMFNSGVKVTATGFAITHIPRALGDYVTDEYAVSAGGVLRIR